MPAIALRALLAVGVLLTGQAAVTGCGQNDKQKQTGGTPVAKAQPEGFLATPATGKGPGVAGLARLVGPE